MNSNNKSFSDTILSYEDDSVLSPFNTVPALSCLTFEDKEIKGRMNQDTNLIDNCEYYAELDTDVYGCIKCSFGYEGLIEEHNQKGFIHECLKFNECEDSIYFDGVDFEFKRFLSCHICKEKGMIPFIAVYSE